MAGFCRSVRRRNAARLLALSLTAFSAASASAAETAAADADAGVSTNPSESIVVTGTRFKAELAPAKASLDITEPQTIINRQYIENFLPATSDYVGILAIAPSMTGTDSNGPGLSDGGVKNTLRGLPDGSFAMLYDGIPFGDTNGPSHHSLSYFPASTIGAAVVDRGPGNAGNLSAATFGGTLKLFSEELSDESHGKAAFSYGSFQTSYENLNVQSGAFGTDATRVLLNIEHKYSAGALSQQDLHEYNVLLKAEHDFGQNWKLTLFTDYANLVEHLNDNNGATPAQVMAYGKNFAMQNTDPTLPTYYKYGRTRKQTDMDYARLQGSVTDNFKIDDTLYTYAYTNHTFSSRNIEQTAAEIAAGTAEGMGSLNSKFTPIVNGVKQPATDVPGYSKLNAYRVWGNILRLSEDYQFGSVTGQLRAGVWWEGNRTIRARYDFDLTRCVQLGLYPSNNYYYIAGQANSLAACQDSSLATAALKNAATLTPNGYAEFDEHSSWYQYQPFAELEIHPIENLTLTPGIKYVDWEHKTSALIEPKLLPLRPYTGQYTTKKTLPFVQANYKIQSSWSIYAEYAQGIYVPDIGSFEQKATVDQFPAAETTTNYQVGTVYYADNFTADADLYLIKVNNNYSTQDCGTLGGLKGDLCFVNTGAATYKGIEAESTYAFSGPLDGFQVFGSGSVMSSKSGGVWIKQAPFWTAAAGVIYKRGAWQFSVMDKTTGPQYEDNAQNPIYKLGSFSTVGLTGGYTFDNFEFDVSIDNLFNSRSVVAITENSAAGAQGFVPNSIDQYFYQAPFSVMGTLKAHF
ncbi:MAG: TonB-dependent receptor [Rhodospirillaceae bacterium]|nr:MAG: TonB-dependent receptor [Rhodospirillaceae bacterium]